MASYVWPPSLPQTPLAAGYSEDDGIVLRSAPMDSGPPQTVFESASGERLAVSFLLTRAQLTTLETFVSSTIRYTYPFDFTHPRTGETVEIVLLPMSESSVLQRACVGPNAWRVSLQFLVLP